MKKVVLIVFNDFKYDNRVLKEALSLQKAGYKVTVFAIWKKGLKVKDNIKSINVYRIKLVSEKLPKCRFVTRLIFYTEYLIKAITMFRNVDILHCNDIDALFIGVFVKIFVNRKVKLVYDAHEYETETIGLKGFKKRILKIIERLLIKYIDALFTVSKSILDDYKKMYNIKKCYLILNCPIHKKITKKNIFREKLGISEDKTIFLYQGFLKEGRAIKKIAKAFERISNKNKVIIFMGIGPMINYILNISNKNANVFYHPVVSGDVLLDYTSSADFGFCLTENLCLNHYYSLPNKLFEYILAGVPPIVSNLYEIKNLVAKNKIGIVLENVTSDSIIEAIYKTENLDVKAVRDSFKKMSFIYNWQNQEKVLLKAYDALYISNNKNKG